MPSDADWDTLQNYLISNSYNYTDIITEQNFIAIAMSSETDWDSFTVVGAPGRDLNCNNGSGFSALPSGHRGSDGVFDGLGRNSHWSCTDEAGYDDLTIDHEVYYYFWYLGRLPMSRISDHLFGWFGIDE